MASTTGQVAAQNAATAQSSTSKTQMTEDQLKVEFDKFDADKNGSIDAEELKKLLEDTLKQKLPASLMQKYTDLHMNKGDKDKNGIIDFTEFCTVYKELVIDPELPIKLTAPKKTSSVVLETGENAPKAHKPLSAASQLSDDERAEALASFEKHDADKSGTIDKAELAILLKTTLGKKMGEKMIERYVDSQFNIHDKDGSGAIDQEEYLELYAKLILHKGHDAPVAAGSAKLPPMF